MSCPQPGNALKVLGAMVRLGVLGVVAQEATSKVKKRMAKALNILIPDISLVFKKEGLYPYNWTKP